MGLQTRRSRRRHVEGEGNRDFPSSRASLATVNPKTHAPFPMPLPSVSAARVLPLRAGGPGRPAERILCPGPALNYVKRLHLRRSPPACGGARGR